MDCIGKTVLLRGRALRTRWGLVGFGGWKSVEKSLDAANTSVCATLGMEVWTAEQREAQKRGGLGGVVPGRGGILEKVSWLAWVGRGVSEREGFLAHFFEVLLPGLGRFGGFGLVFLFGGFEAFFVDFESLLVFAIVFDDFFCSGPCDWRRRFCSAGNGLRCAVLLRSNRGDWWTWRRVWLRCLNRFAWRVGGASRR